MRPYQHYRLRHRKPKPCSLIEWTESFNCYNRYIRQTHLPNYHVSTVFLGLEHIGGMFETIIFSKLDNDLDGYIIRSETHRGALKNHLDFKKMIKLKTKINQH